MLVVAKTHVGARQISVDRRIVRIVEVQFFGRVPGACKVLLVEQESHVCFAQLKIKGGKVESGGDGLCCLAIVVRRRCLVGAADVGQREIVIGFGLLGVGRDLLLGGCDTLLSGSRLLRFRLGE